MINTIRDQSTKTGCEYPHLEDIVVGKDYALTINPARQLPEFVLTYLEHKEFIESHLLGSADYTLRPELSTKSTRLHWHGTLRFKSHRHLVSFYYVWIPRLKDHCNFSIKPIDDWQWKLYCIKQRHHMKSFISILKVPKIVYKLTSRNALEQ